MAWLPHATGGVISGTFVANAVIALLVMGFLIGICRRRPREFGLDPAKLPAALGLTALAWAANQVVLLLVLPLTGHGITLNPQWTAPDWTRAAGAWIGQMFANAPLEEAVFRGFLLPQCLLLMLHRMPNARPASQIAMALVVSQGLLALPHVFFNLHQPEGQWLLLAQFIMGLLFAGVYLRTGNLFLAAGLHALVNNPGPLLQDPYPGIGLGGGCIALGMFLAVIFGPRVARRLRRAGNEPKPHKKHSG
jgi:membrane protease YdiL (CAAX protease family)